jgi:large subunit ribosomal protein L46
MDTWIVGRHPIGVHRADSEPRVRDIVLISTYLTLSPLAQTFFFKGHILAGQAHPDGNEVLDFAWFTKQEIRERVGNEYFDAVRDLLAGF